MPHFMIMFILYINLLNLSWIKKCLFLRNMEHLTSVQQPIPILVISCRTKVDYREVVLYSRTSMARTSRGPCTFVLNMGSSSH